MKLLPHILDFIDRLAIRYTVWNWHRNRKTLHKERIPDDWKDHCVACLTPTKG